MDILDWKKALVRKLGLWTASKFNSQPKGNFLPTPEQQHFCPSSPFVPIETAGGQHYIDRLANAEFAYQDWQLQNGFEVLDRGTGPQDASELQNLMAFQESHGISMPVENYAPETAGLTNEFYAYANQTEFMDGMQEDGALEPEEMGNLPGPDMGTALADEHMAEMVEALENMEPMPEEMAQEPVPDPMEDPMQMDPNDPMNPVNQMDPMGMDLFDPMMGPMGMGGPVGP